MDRRNILMTHFTSPTNFGLVNDSQRYEKKLFSPSCSDELTIQIASDNEILIDLKFAGSACVIATSSADILLTMLKGQSFAQATDFLNRYQAMILEGHEPDPDFGELIIFDNVHRQKGRWTCATLVSQGILDFINQKSA